MRTRIVFLALAMAAAAYAQTAGRVIMLGSGSPNADPARSGPTAAVVVGHRIYLVDAGVGIVRRAAAAKLPVAKLDRVFITHLHTDHTLGLPDLIFTPWVLGRRAPLQAYGPVGLQAMVNSLLLAWKEDIAVRIHGLEKANRTGYKVNVHEIGPGQVYHDANVSVSAFAVHHGIWKEALGYRFVVGGHVIVFSGDTTPVESVVQACNGCDLLFHEVYYANPRQTKTWAAYLASSHTSAGQLGRLASRAHPKLLVLDHLLFEGGTAADLMTQLRRTYSGPVVASHDLQVFPF